MVHDWVRGEYNEDEEARSRSSFTEGYIEFLGDHRIDRYSLDYLVGYSKRGGCEITERKIADIKLELNANRHAKRKI